MRQRVVLPVSAVSAVLAVLAMVTLVAGGLAAAFTAGAGRADGTTYTVLQMNLCLSGRAGCYPRTSYPSVVDEAADQVVDDAPQAVTLNEACSGDARRLAARTGYHLHFAAVRVDGGRLPCVLPEGRGVFGIAVLTRDPVASSRDHAFAGQSGEEERRWVCATTTRAVTVCTAHLGTRGSADARRANDAECAELRGVLAGYDAAGTTVFGGDLNRRTSCAPSTMWAAEDSAAGQLPGIQHIYGSRSVRESASQVAAATHTDHDFFLADGPVAAGSTA